VKIYTGIGIHPIQSFYLETKGKFVDRTSSFDARIEGDEAMLKGYRFQGFMTSERASSRQFKGSGVTRKHAGETAFWGIKTARLCESRTTLVV